MKAHGSCSITLLKYRSTDEMNAILSFSGTMYTQTKYLINKRTTNLDTVLEYVPNTHIVYA